MTTVPVEITLPPQRTDDRSNERASLDEIEFLDDLDDVASTAAMLGCGDDNPYR